MKIATNLEQVSLNEKSRPLLIASGDIERMAALALATGLTTLPAAMRARVIQQLSRVAGTIWYKTNRGTVRRVRHHLQLLFNYQETDPMLESQVRDQLILASWNALIANLLPSLREKHLVGLCQIDGLHYVDKMRQQNKAILLLGFHYGVYGYAIVAALTAQGYPARLVAYGAAQTEPPRVSYLYRKLYWPRLQRVNRWLKTIAIDPVRKSQPELHNILEQKSDIVYLLADQYFVVLPGQAHASHLVPLRLLNQTVYLDITGVQAAKKMDVQPFTAIPVKNGYRQRVVIEPLEWASDGTTRADIAQDLQLYLNRFEQSLLAYPALWRELRRTELLARIGIFEREGTANE